MTDAKYQRVLLKLSGEALMGDNDFGIDSDVLAALTAEVIAISQLGVEVGIVIGGGNIFRGAGLAQAGIDRTRADQMGMLATVMNALAVQDQCIKQGAKAVVLSAFSMEQACEPYSAQRARSYLDQGYITLMAAGSGNPYFTTDTAASLRALEIQADVLIKGTKVDGVYDSDPKLNPDAKRYDQLSFDDAISQQLGVMDLTAMVLCRDNGMPMQVYNLFEQGKLSAIIRGESTGTCLQPNVV
ncbi:MAG: UMP kinase [Thiotrichaceae bacterium]|nr:UMP kinase [Thiotrichaceae bacterium]